MSGLRISISSGDRFSLLVFDLWPSRRGTAVLAGYRLVFVDFIPDELVTFFNHNSSISLL